MNTNQNQNLIGEEEELEKEPKIVPTNPAAYEPKASGDAGSAPKETGATSALTGQDTGSNPLGNAGAKPTIVPTNPAAHVPSVPAATGFESDGGSDKKLGGDEMTEANIGVRDMLGKYFGVNGEKLGFDGENVTYDGKYFATPDALKSDDRTYVDDEEKLSSAVSEYVKNNGLVAIRDYANTHSGTPLNISWNGENGTVEINGQTIKPDFVVGGKAYIRQDTLDAVLGNIEDESGIRSSTDIYADTKAKYGPGLDNAYNEYMNYGKFSYNPQNDKSYQAFMDVYNRAVQDEYNQNMAQAKFRTGGLASPAVMANAAAVRDRAMADSAQYLQQFEDRAYNRYLDDRNFAGDKMNTTYNMLVNSYDLENSASKDAREAWYMQDSYDKQSIMHDVELKQKLIDLGISEKDAEQYLSYIDQIYKNQMEQDNLTTENMRKSVGYMDGTTIIDAVNTYLNGQATAREYGFNWPFSSLDEFLKQYFGESYGG